MVLLASSFVWGKSSPPTDDPVQMAYERHDIRTLQEGVIQGGDEIQSRSLKALILLADPQIIPFLRKQLDQDNPKIIEETLWGLPSFGSAATSGDIPDKVKALMASPHFGVRKTAEIVSYDLQNLDEYVRMKGNLESAFESEQTEGLNFFVSRKDLSILLHSRTFLQQSDARQRLLGIKLAHELDDRDTLGDMHKLISDPVPAVRAEAARVIVDWEGSFSIGLVKPLLQDPNPAVRGIVILALGKIADPTVSQLLSELKKDKSQEVRLALAKALGGFASPESTTALLEFSVDDNPFIYAPAVEGLAGFKNPRVDALMAKYLEDKESRRRRRAAVLYYSDSHTLGDPMKLLPRLHDSDEEIRQLAAEGIFRMPGAQAKSRLVYVLDDKSPRVRSVVYQHMDELLKLPALNRKLLKQKLEQLSKDKDPQTQLLAKQALTKLQ